LDYFNEAALSVDVTLHQVRYKNDHLG